MRSERPISNRDVGEFDCALARMGLGPDPETGRIGIAFL
jgi:hypothetical protein